MTVSTGSSRREQSVERLASVPSLKLSQAKRSRMISVSRFEGQQLVLLEIEGRTLYAGTILHGGGGFRGKCSAVDVAAGAGFTSP